MLSTTSNSPPSAATTMAAPPSFAVSSTAPSYSSPADMKPTTTTNTGSSSSIAVTPSTSAQTSAAPTAGAPPRANFTNQLRRAVEQGVVNHSFAAEIKRRFATPFSAHTASPAATATTATTKSGVVPLTSANATQPQSAGMPSLLSSVTPMDLANKMQRSGADVQYARNALEFLNLLSACESGSYNSDDVAPGMASTDATTQANHSNNDAAFGRTSDNARAPQEDNGAGATRGLHSAVAAIAHSAVSNTIAYLTRELSSTEAGSGRLSEAVMAHALPTAVLSRRNAAHGSSMNYHAHNGVGGAGSAPEAYLAESGTLDDVESEEEDGSEGGLTAMRTTAVTHAAHNPLLLAAQCLYMLTRHFQMQASHVRDLLGLLEQLCTRLVREDGNSTGQQAAAAASFFSAPLSSSSSSSHLLASITALRELPQTRSLSCLLWLVLFSAVNAMAVWKRVRAGEDGAMRLNVLTQSDVASQIDSTVRALRGVVSTAMAQTPYDTAAVAQESANTPRHFGPSARTWQGLMSTPHRDGSAYSDRNMHHAYRDTHAWGEGGGSTGGLLRASTSASSTTAAAASAPPLPFVLSPWLQAVCGYVSILRLAQGCLLRAKDDDRGFECALEALLGSRAGRVGATGREGQQVQALRSEGAVAKRMLQLAPLPHMLRIPLDYVYITPYEILSYLFDNMVPVLRHVAEMELASCRRFADQMQRLDEAVVLSRRAETGQEGGLAQVRRDNQSHNLLYQQQQGQQMHDGWQKASMYEPFLDVMSDMLHALAMCLAELPAEVLNPDFNADCAATFFIFRNCARHLVHVFRVQRGTGTLWETFALRLVARFMDVLTMIGRNAQYTARVAELLSGAQDECPELQWTSLLVQALACAGVRSNAEAITQTTTGEAMPPTGTGSGRIYASLYQANNTADGNSTSNNTMYYGTSAVNSSVAIRPELVGLPKQFTLPYARAVQQQFIISFFMLLRQMCGHGSSVQHAITKLLPLNFCLALITAPQQTQATLGSTLSLIAARVQSASDAAVVWLFLQRSGLLQEPSYQTPAIAAATTSMNRPMVEHALPDARNIAATPTNLNLLLRSSSGGSSGGAAAAVGSESAAVQVLSLLGHCRYEAAQGSYDITVGVLHLMMALLLRLPPTTSTATMGCNAGDVSHGSTGRNSEPVLYSSEMHRVMYFVSHEVLRGVLRRSFHEERQMYIVCALASAVLRQALLPLTQPPAVCASAATGVVGSAASAVPWITPDSSVPNPFTMLLAMDKAPHDVIGELLTLVARAAGNPHALTSHQRAAVRHGIRLLCTAVDAAAAQSVELFALDARITRSSTLPRHLFALCAVYDPRLTSSALELLQRVPASTMQQTVQQLHCSPCHSAMLLSSAVTRLTALLGWHDAPPAAQEPRESRNAPRVAVAVAPPELASLDQLDSSAMTWGGCHSTSLSAQHVSLGCAESASVHALARARLLELLLQHARSPTPSLTLLLCGLYSAAVRGYGTEVGSSHVDVNRMHDRYSNQVGESKVLLAAVVAGATSTAAAAGQSMGETSGGDDTMGRSRRKSTIEDDGAADWTVQCVKLMYRMRTNPASGPAIVRPYLRQGCHTLFRQLTITPPALCVSELRKRALVLRLLALEVYDAHMHTPLLLQWTSKALRTVALDVLFTLLDPARELAARRHRHSHVSHDDGSESGEASDGMGSSGVADAQDDGSGAAMPYARRTHLEDAMWWPVHLLRQLPTFPEACYRATGTLGDATTIACVTSSNNKDSRAIDAADDDERVVQFDLAALYDHVAAEQRERGLAAPGMGELQARLMPFVEANAALRVYAAAVSVVHGWCFLMDVAVSFVRGLPAQHRRVLVSAILSALQLVAQRRLPRHTEQHLGRRLIATLSTVLVTLTRCEDDSAMYEHADDDDDDDDDGMPDAMGDREARSSNTDEDDDDALLSRRGRRRGRSCFPGTRNSGRRTDATHRTPSHAPPPSLRRVDTIGGAGARAHWVQSWQSYLDAQAASQSRYSSSSSSLAAPSVNQSLLRPVLQAVVQWGSQLPASRPELYHCLFTLLQLPGVGLEDRAMYRAQEVLLRLLVEDVSGGAGWAGECGTPVTWGSSRTHRSVPMPTRACDAVCGGHNMTAVTSAAWQMSASTLLVCLLTRSPALCAVFCRAPYSAHVAGAEVGSWTGQTLAGAAESALVSPGALSLRAVHTAAALLRRLDAVVMASVLGAGETAGVERDVGTWVHLSFDLLSAMTRHHSAAVVQSGLLRAVCTGMDVWTLSAQVARSDAMRAAATTQRMRAMIRVVLLGTVQWLNLLLTTAQGDDMDGLNPIYDFVQRHRALMNGVLHSMATTTAQGAAEEWVERDVVSGSLCAEWSELLRALAASALTLRCRSLMSDMMLPQLVLTLLRAECARQGQPPWPCRNGVLSGRPTRTQEAAAMHSRERCCRHDNRRDSTNRQGTVRDASAAVSYRCRQVSCVARTVRDLVHVLLRLEYGDDDITPHRDAAGAAHASSSSANTVLLRHGARQVECIVEATDTVTRCLSAAAPPLCALQTECYLYTLQALVCLLHTFVLPRTDGSSVAEFPPPVTEPTCLDNGRDGQDRAGMLPSRPPLHFSLSHHSGKDNNRTSSTHRTTSWAFVDHLRALPLARMADVLHSAQQLITAACEGRRVGGGGGNEDDDGGMAYSPIEGTAQQTPNRGGVMWQHQSDPRNENNKDARSLLHAHARAGHESAHARGQTVVSGAGSSHTLPTRSPSLAPGTPLIHPADGTRLMGTRESSSAVVRDSGLRASALRQQQQQQPIHDAAPSARPGPDCVQESSHRQDPTTVGDILDEANAQQGHGGVARDAERAATVLPGRPVTSGDDRNDNDVAHQAVDASGRMVMATLQGKPYTNHLIQQVAIALANAIRAVQTAQKKLIL